MLLLPPLWLLPHCSRLLLLLLGIMWNAAKVRPQLQHVMSCGGPCFHKAK